MLLKSTVAELGMLIITCTAVMRGLAIVTTGNILYSSTGHIPRTRRTRFLPTSALLEAFATKSCREVLIA